MDEPLASLDAQRKDEILPYIERLRDETRIPIVYVSHSVAEVTRLATTMVLLSDGKVDAVGSVAEVMGRLDLAPKTGRFEAGAVLDMHIVGRDERYGLTRLRSAAGDILVPHLDLPDGAAIRIRIRARDVIVAIAPPHGSQRPQRPLRPHRRDRRRHRRGARPQHRARRRQPAGSRDPALV